MISIEPKRREKKNKNSGKSAEKFCVKAARALELVKRGNRRERKKRKREKKLYKKKKEKKERGKSEKQQARRKREETREKEGQRDRGRENKNDYVAAAVNVRALRRDTGTWCVHACARVCTRPAFMLVRILAAAGEDGESGGEMSARDGEDGRGARDGMVSRGRTARRRYRDVL